MSGASQKSRSMLVGELKAKVAWLEGQHQSIVGWPWDAPFQDGYDSAKDEYRGQLIAAEARERALEAALLVAIEDWEDNNGKYREGHGLNHWTVTSRKLLTARETEGDAK